MKAITEAKDVTTYQKLIKVLGDYSTRFPATGIDTHFQAAIDNGIKIMPKDKQALAIISSVLDSDNTPASVHKLLNLRFTDLPMDTRPVMKSGRKKEVAFWNSSAGITDKVIGLINFEGAAGGKWCDINGNSVQLIDVIGDK